MCGLAPSRILGAVRYAVGGWDSATIRFQPLGSVQVITGTSPHGQGHETAWAQIAADLLGVDVDEVEVLHGDTAVSQLGMDTYGSRSLAVGGIALWHASEKIVEKARAIVAHQLEVAADDLEFANGTFSVKGSPDKAMTIKEAAFAAHDGAQPAGRPRAWPRGDGGIRPAELLVAFGSSRRGRRGRHRDGRRAGSSATSRSTTSVRPSTR